MTSQKQKPMDFLSIVVKTMLSAGTYRIQREPFTLYPETNGTDKTDPGLATREGLLKSVYRLFEMDWVESFDSNPYRFLTQNQIDYGINSEFALSFDPFRSVAYIDYSIQPEDPAHPVITFPITQTIPMSAGDIATIGNPMERALKDLISRADDQHFDEVNEQTIALLSETHPSTKQVWFTFKEQLIMQLSQVDFSTLFGNSEWKESIYQNHVVITMTDENHQGYPSISIFDGDPVIQNRNELNRADMVVPSPMFSFSRVEYEPFTDPLS